MQANWSLVLNVLLLGGVVIAIGRMMRARRQKLNMTGYRPSIGQSENTPQHHDEIIAVRKVATDSLTARPVIPPPTQSTLGSNSFAPKTTSFSSKLKQTDLLLKGEKKSAVVGESVSSIMMFLLAKQNRQLAGYELLQTVLASGLRFGEGNIFHRHQSPNGQGPVLCSLAAATPTGVFDLQNIGAFSVHGLCLFMQASGNQTIDAERFNIMLETARQLSEGLDTHLLDDQRQPLTDASVKRYYRMLNLGEVYETI